MGFPPPLAPDRQPVVGHTLSVLREPLATLERWGRTDESILRVQVAGQQLCLVTAPEATEQVLATDHASYRKASIVRDRLGTLQGGSLVLLDGDQWRERRQLLQAGFTSDRVAAAGSLTTSYTTAMVEEWSTETPIEIVDETRTLVLAILADALFGLELDGDRTPIHDAADDILARMDLRSVSAYLPEWVPTPRNVRFRRAVSTLHGRLDAIVDREREREGGPAGESLLSIMLAADLPPETVRDELIALLFAGYDSTATALSCALAELGAHPDVQSTLQTELDAVLDGRSPTPADLPELPLLDAVVRETLRLYPPQYLLFREPTTTVTLEGYRIDRDTTVVLPPWVLQRDDRFWDAPTAFRPDRWLDDTTTDADRPACAYVPYGVGSRYCLGAGLADQTLRLAIAVLCQHRHLESRDSLSVVAGPTLSVDGRLRLRATRR